jgi:Mg2+ and Co2+ transporter CorA
LNWDKEEPEKVGCCLLVKSVGLNLQLLWEGIASVNSTYPVRVIALVLIILTIISVIVGVFGMIDMPETDIRDYLEYS